MLRNTSSETHLLTVLTLLHNLMTRLTEVAMQEQPSPPSEADPDEKPGAVDSIGRPHVSDLWCADRCEFTAPDTSGLEISFSHVIRQFEWFDNHLTLPCFSLPPGFPTPPACLQWIDLPWWDYQVVADEIHMLMALRNQRAVEQALRLLSALDIFGSSLAFFRPVYKCLTPTELSWLQRSSA